MADIQTPITSTASHYYMHPDALRITLNALGDSSLLAVSVYANAAVMAYYPDVIGYAPDRNYKTWRLSAFNTHFDDQLPRYCHIALSRTTDAALVVYPTTRLDILGRPISDDGRYFLDAAGAPITATVPGASASGDTTIDEDPDSYYIFIGLISEPVGGQRHWSSVLPFTTGNLDTDQHRNEERNGQLDKMFVLNEVMGWIEQRLPINLSHIYTLALGYGRKLLRDVFKLNNRDEDFDAASGGNGVPLDEIVPTEAHMRDYGEKQYLSRTKDDTAQGNITFNKDIAVLGDATIGSNATVAGNITSVGHIGSDNFQTGLLGSGWRADNDGHVEFDSVSIRKFLEVPELRFNRISVRTGVQWQTFGGGLIEAVYPDPNGATNRGIIKLHLEDGEYGAIVPDDKCMGIYHFEGEPLPDVASGSAVGPNAQDDHNGNFAFAGFSTIYFRVVAICDEHGDTTNPDPSNRYFLYELRPDWRMNGFDHDIASKHPQPSMSFAAYANPRDEDRQACEYSTTEYTIQLAGMTDWTYTSDNIQFIYGRLKDFTISVRTQERDAEGNLVFNTDGTPLYNIVYYPLQGYGIATGNIYKWGNETTIERPRTLISQQLYYCASNLAPDQFLATYTDSQPDWQTTPLSPSPATPYVYAFWLKTYIEGSIESQERSSAFLLATYGESAITPRWSQPIVPIYVKQSGWIIDDVPPAITQLAYEQRVSVTVSLAKGIDEYIPISSIFRLANLSDLGNHPTIADLETTPLTTDGHTWRIEFTVRDFTIADSVTLSFSLDTPNGSIAAPLVLSPTFSGADGSNGTNGTDAVVYEVEPSQNNFIVDPEENEVVTTGITFRVFQVNGNQPRQPLRGYYYRVEFFEQNGSLIPEIPVIGQYSQDPEVTIPLATSLYHLTMAEILHYIKFSVIAEDQTELKTITVTRVNAGEQGPQGIPGTDGHDAVLWQIESSSDVIHTNSAGSATTALRCTLYKTIGSQRTAYTDAEWVVDITRGMISGITHEFQGSNFNLSATTLSVISSATVRAYDASVTPRRLVATRTFLAVADGANGLQGAVIRQRGEWSAEAEYVNQSASKQSDLRYIDIVQVKTQTGIDYFECKPTADGFVNKGHNPASPDWQSWWTKADCYPFIATQLLLAENANIKFGQNNQLLITDTDGEIIGGFTGFTIDEYGNKKQNPIRLWVGATDPNDAPFHVKHDGTMFAANVNSAFQDISFCHTYKDPFGEPGGFEAELIRTGATAYKSDGTTIQIVPRVWNVKANGTELILPNDASFIGQRILICNDITTFDADGEDSPLVTTINQENGEPFIGLGIWTATWRHGGVVNGKPIGKYDYKYTPITSIKFFMGTMEFVAVPSGSGCVWSLIHDGTLTKWYQSDSNYLPIIPQLFTLNQ